MKNLVMLAALIVGFNSTNWTHAAGNNENGKMLFLQHVIPNLVSGYPIFLQQNFQKLNLWSSRHYHILKAPSVS